MPASKFQVPKHNISWLVAKLHVGTPDATVEADIRDRLQRLASETTPAQRNACVKYALKCHRDNQALFNRYHF